jgi:hypothetical protein
MQYDNSQIFTKLPLQISEIRDKKRLESIELCLIGTVGYPLSGPRRKGPMIPVTDTTKQKPSINSEVFRCFFFLFVHILDYFGGSGGRNPVRAHPFNIFFPVSSACNIEVNEKPGFILQNSKTQTCFQNIFFLQYRRILYLNV